jgi:hypothetical protein
MKRNFDHKQWDVIKVKLNKLYPNLTNSDLIWRHGSLDELLKMIASKLGKTKNEIQAELDAI